MRVPLSKETLKAFPFCVSSVLFRSTEELLGVLKSLNVLFGFSQWLIELWITQRRRNGKLLRGYEDNNLV